MNKHTSSKKSRKDETNGSAAELSVHAVQKNIRTDQSQQSPDPITQVSLLSEHNLTTTEPAQAERNVLGNSRYILVATDSEAQ